MRIDGILGTNDWKIEGNFGVYWGQNIGESGVYEIAFGWGKKRIEEKIERFIMIIFEKNQQKWYPKVWVGLILVII